jgi:DDE family transposase
MITIVGIRSRWCQGAERSCLSRIPSRAIHERGQYRSLRFRLNSNRARALFPRTRHLLIEWDSSQPSGRWPSLRGRYIREKHLSDSRRGKNVQFPLADLLRQSTYSRLAGYEDVNDAERLSQDPTFRLIGSEKIWERGAALTSRLQTFETETLTVEDNFAGLARINRELIGKVEAVGSPQREKVFWCILPTASLA